MPNLELFDDYYEQWRPDKPSCYDCQHVEHPFPSWKEPSNCLLLARKVDRAMGHCSQFIAGGNHA